MTAATLPWLMVPPAPVVCRPENSSLPLQHPLLTCYTHHLMSGQESSDDETDLAIELRGGPVGRANTKAAGESSSSYLKTVVRQQQDTTKTCRLLALEVGSLKAELTREQKKRAQAISRATKAEAAHQHAEQRLHEVQYSNSKLQQELTAAKDAAESSSRRVHSLRQSLADAEAEAQERLTLGQQQVCNDFVLWCVTVAVNVMAPSTQVG